MPPARQCALQRPACIAAMQVLQTAFRQLAGMLAAGTVAPLPAQVHAFADITQALRQFSHARHVGKIVVKGPPAAAALGKDDATAGSALPEAWAVTGGLGALGQLAGEWLAGQGVKHISLLGRSGRWSEPASGAAATSCLFSSSGISASAGLLGPPSPGCADFGVVCTILMHASGDCRA